MNESLITGLGVTAGILYVAFNIGILILLIYVLFYRIPKALIKFAIEKYFQEKRMDAVYRGNSQIPPTAPSYQGRQQSEHHQE